MEIQELYQIYLTCSGITTDSRSVGKDSLFFALKGEHFDGNKYAESSLENGARYAVVSDPALSAHASCILVNDTLTCLQQLASYHRKMLNIPVIAITGSNGKTTTKELCRDVLAKKYALNATKGNLNNHIGVPLTILSTKEGTEILIVEMGANHQGEIDALCHIADPDYVIITNIGKAHLEGFGGIEGIKRGKSEMYRYAAHHHKHIFINTEDDVLSSLIPPGCKTINYATSSLIHLITESPFITFGYKGNAVATKLYGSYNLTNIAFAIAAGEYFEVNTSDIMDAIASYQPDNNRSQLVHAGSNTFIMDAYNANPSSMLASISSFSKMDGNHKVLVLGDMLELGEYTKEEHRKMVQFTQDLGFKEVIFVGEHFTSVQQEGKGFFFKDLENARDFFNKKHYTNALILLKGSRGIAIEKLIT